MLVNGQGLLSRPATSETRKRTTNTTNRILAFSAAPAAIPVKPKIAAMIATMKNASAQLSMTSSLNCGKARGKQQSPCPCHWLPTWHRHRACNDCRVPVRTACAGALPRRISATGYPWHISCCMLVMRLEQEEEARRHACETLRAPARARFMDESVPAMVWTARLDLSCEYVSREWLEFTGYRAEQALGDGWSRCVHPEDLARWLDVCVRAFDAREPFQIEYRLRRRDGE